MDKQRILNLIDETLNTLLPAQNGPLQILYEGARYLTFAPSKRVRPLLVAAVALEFNVPLSKILYPACALECVHTYSLIHDDLPCMDNDDMRRGQPALHKVFDEGVALLIGDFLLTLAFETLANAPELVPDQKITLVKILSEYAGGEGMVGGQLMDLKKTALAKEINKKKTGSLFVTAFQFGAILGNASEMRKAQLSLAGEKVGALFQLIDDFTDGDCESNETNIAEAQMLYDQSVTLIGNNPLALDIVSNIFNYIGANYPDEPR